MLMLILGAVIMAAVSFFAGWSLAECVITEKVTLAVAKDMVASSPRVKQKREKLGDEHVDALVNATQEYLKRL